MVRKSQGKRQIKGKPAGTALGKNPGWSQGESEIFIRWPKYDNATF